MGHDPHRQLASLWPALLCAALLPAQFAQRVDTLPVPEWVVWDSHRGCYVAQAYVHEQWDTWELHGAHWLWRQTGGAQPDGSFAFHYYDAVRRRTFALQTRALSGSRSHWEWDGFQWSQHAESGAPSPRDGAAFAHDPARNVVSMVCGIDRLGTWMLEHWEWNGSAWAQLAVATPSARVRAVMCFDPARNSIVLHGGNQSTAYWNDTWTFDGTAWTQRATTGPSLRLDPALAFDAARQRVVLYGGSPRTGNGDPLADEWVWDGAAWTLVAANAAPGPAGWPNIQSPSGLWLPARVTFLAVPSGLAFFSFADYGALWTHGASGWSRSLAARLPVLRRGNAFVYDGARAEIVLFGGSIAPFSTPSLGDTWTWNGDWRLRAPLHSPPARKHAGMAFDPARNEVVLFGGVDNGVVLGDTWAWDGTDWRQRLPAASPAPRSGCPMTYHSARGEVVLRGGSDAGGSYFTDTWTWNGATWRLAATGGPPARGLEAFVDDRARGVVVLAGGLFGFVGLRDTWEWDGVTWQQRGFSGAAPTGVAFFDPQAGRVAQIAHERREWDGSSWNLVPTTDPLPDLMFGQGVWDEGRQRAILYGREAGSDSALCVLGPTPARAAGNGAGCGSPAPRLLLVGRGRIGERGLHLQADVGAPLAPAFVLIGWSDQGGTIGACRVRVAGVVAWLAIAGDATGYARAAVDVPPVPALRGLAAHLQMAALAPGGPLVGHTLSNGLRILLGD